MNAILILVDVLPHLSEPHAIHQVFRALCHLSNNLEDSGVFLARFALGLEKGGGDWVRTDDMHETLARIGQQLADVALASNDDAIRQRYLEVSHTWELSSDLQRVPRKTARILELIATSMSADWPDTARKRQLHDVVERLGNLGTSDATMALLRLCHSGNNLFQLACVDALVKMGSRVLEHWPTIWQGFGPNDTELKLSLMEVSIDIGPQAARHELSQLLRQYALSDPDPNVRDNGQRWLRKVQTAV